MQEAEKAIMASVDVRIAIVNSFITGGTIIILLMTFIFWSIYLETFL